MRMIIDENKNNLKNYGCSVKQHLEDKHPERQPPFKDVLFKNVSNLQPHMNIIYKEINGQLIKSIIQKMSGSAGPCICYGHNWVEKTLLILF